MKWHIYQSPTPPFKNSFYSNQGGKALALVPLSYAMAVRVVEPGFVNRGPKGGSKATEWGRVWERGFPLTVVRFFSKFVYENGIFLHIQCYY